MNIYYFKEMVEGGFLIIIPDKNTRPIMIYSANRIFFIYTKCWKCLMKIDAVILSVCLNSVVLTYY